jgi:hypothetical protein
MASAKVSPNSWGQDEYMLVRELFRYIDKEPQEVTKAWSLLTQHHRALLTCLMDMLTEPEHFLQSADMISLVYPESLDTEKEWVRKYAVFPIAACVAAFASSFLCQHLQ